MTHTTEQYFLTKDTAKRNETLKYFVLNPPADAKEFFLRSFKKERYLDMKLIAVRGYAAFATEGEVCVVMDKLLELLKKRPEKTPYSYEEYEIMRSVFLMPYLLDRYSYECFRVFNEQLEKQYNAMPDCFKDIFTLDQFGNSYNLRAPAEVKQSLNAFWGR